tara:strand:- start:15064 stop:15228 length:165 start_codon:yes stop_codon:yes gene_type:complete
MNGSAAKKLRKIIGYDKKNPNPIHKRLYTRLKKRYGSSDPKKFWKELESRFNNE